MKFLKPKTIKGLIFDYGGTLDTGGRHWAWVLWDGYCSCSIPVLQAQFREAYVYGERELAKNPIIQPSDNFRDLLAKKIHLEFQFFFEQNLLHFSDVKRFELENQITDYCYNYARKVTHISGEVLNKLSKKYSLVLVTNFYSNMHAVLQDFKLDSFFNDIVESAVCGVRKPNPEIYRLGVEALRMLPEEVCVVGDSFDKDILPAQSIGCHTIWFEGEPWQPQQFDRSIPDAIINRVELLPEILENI